MLAAATTARAEVEFSISPEPYYVGSPITLAIDVINESNHEPPRAPQIDGADVRELPPSRSSQISMGTGRKRTVTESVSYRIEIIPRRAGRLEIPSIEVVVNGTPMRTAPQVVQVEKSDTADLLFVEVHADRDSVYLGESLEIRLEIWLRPMVNRAANFGDVNDMWQCIDQRRSVWGPFAVLLQDTKNINVQTRIRQGNDGTNREYFVYRLARTHWPERTGALDLGDINIIVEYPLQVDRDRSVFSFFNEPRVLRSRPLSAPATLDPIAVKPVPTQGQPPSYTGAVGRYEFEAEARPLQVQVGDPITLTMSLRGSGRLDLLQPPKLEVVEPLVRQFKMPSDPLAGVVEGNVKRFTQTLRARDPSVTEIPALPFTYFDPREERFVTISSNPIPIQVTASDRLAVSNAVEAETGQRIATRLTRREDGIVANVYDVDRLLAKQEFSPGAGTAAWLSAPPAIYLASVFVRRRRERLKNDVGYARRHGARARALRAITETASSPDPLRRATAALDALSGYVADRCLLPPGALTRTETIGHLRSRRVSEEAIRAVDDVLAEAEGLRYAGTTGAVDSMPDRARRCIGMLERERF